MIVMLMFVIVFVVGAPVAESHLAGEAGISQESEGAVDGRLADRRILSLNETVEIFARNMTFSPQKDIENKVTLSSAL